MIWDMTIQESLPVRLRPWVRHPLEEISGCGKLEDDTKSLPREVRAEETCPGT
jgi:hypothetical protein